MRKLLGICMLMLLLIIPATIGAEESKAEGNRINPALLSSLREGGYILYVRHGEAGVGEDQPNLDFGKCITQRNLTEEGRRQAKLYGEVLRSLKIPVQTPIQASPFCRTRESAELAFGKGNVQVDPFWVKIYSLSGQVTPAEQASTLAALSTGLEQAQPAGTNKVIVAHGFPKGVGLGDIPNLGTVVIRPRGAGKGYEVVDRITLNELLSLHESTLTLEMAR
ncbi:histidine phosphatase family protein [Paenibacillus zeisoli]|uniref:Histidine phosphatase family protein n=1 Tax=Paenibacillus zeisoli TaxID=2496267 RepID=A0A3S1JQI9_9BACL|nr:histidine phosphatase family protein [Paenibacillus zeisoli]RUT33576.1 histidine phosphatase family protein [Paenibacillus zeisoli]